MVGPVLYYTPLYKENPKGAYSFIGGGIRRVGIIRWPDHSDTPLPALKKLYNEQFQALIAAQSPGGNSLYDAIFPITVQYQLRTPPGIPQAPVVTDTLNGCRLAGQGIDLSAGNGVLTVKYPLYIAVIFWNGRQPLAGLTQ